MRKLDFVKVEKHLVSEIQKYFTNAGFTKGLIGLSGGVDSAVVAALTAKAIGPDKMKALSMPSVNTSTATLASVDQLEQHLGIKVEQYRIDVPTVTLRQLLGWDMDYAGVPAQNLQARVRGVLLMSVANIEGRLVVATGNRSENLTGYCTLYGDTVGAFESIGMLYKTEVYELARQLKLPQITLDLIPSAELAPGQTDEAELLPYSQLDKLLQSWEEGDDVSTIARKSKTNKNEVERIIKRIGTSEFKRQQTAPSIKLSKKCFK
jgi:NAD+ synthase (glutamine-hydrolysing)